jgi:hypothetical protein
VISQPYKVCVAGGLQPSEIRFKYGDNRITVPTGINEFSQTDHQSATHSVTFRNARPVCADCDDMGLAVPVAIKAGKSCCINRTTPRTVRQPEIGTTRKGHPQYSIGSYHRGKGGKYV